MVGKVTSGSSFKGLANYLTDDAKRVAWTEPRSVFGTDPQEIAREMQAAASIAERVEKPVYHLSISFDEKDQPTREQMRAAADHVLRELGLEEHQAFLVAHRDKDHPHVHIMVNRVHPETGRAADVAFDYKRIEEALRSLEKEWGMTRVPGHHARSADDPAPERTRALSTGEIRQSRRTGELPFPEQVRERLGNDVQRTVREAKGWGELQEVLGRHGYRIEPTGRGMVITDGEHYAKASAVHEELSRSRLEARFGQPLPDALQSERVSGGLQQGDRLRQEVPEAAVQGPPSKADEAISRGTTAEREGRPPAYEQLFGRPALERSADGFKVALPREPPSPATRSAGAERVEQAAGGSRSDLLLGALRAAARSISSEDGEKEVPLRTMEVGVQAAAALAGRPATEEKSPARGEAPAVSAPLDGRSSMGGDTAVSRLRNDIKAYEHAALAERRLSAAVGAYAEAESKLRSAGRLEQEAARLSQTFDRVLGEAYCSPAEARLAFEGVARTEGVEAAARAMRQEPERFGAVVEIQQRKWLGLASQASRAEAYAAARGAANIGEQYLHSRAAVPGAAARAGLEKTLRVCSAEIQGLRQELARSGRPAEILERIGRQVRGLTAFQMDRLSRMLTPRQLSIIGRAAGLTLQVAKGRDH